VYLSCGDARLFGRLHPAAGDAPRTDAAVLLCSPWGWDEVASYRPRRAWAMRLARAGYPTLRFDLPGTGNSTGTPRDPDLVRVWIDSVAVAADWLRSAGGRPRLVALALGLGSWLATAAIEAGADIDELVSWAAPPSGKAFVRQSSAFSRLQGWNIDERAGDGDALSAVGDIEAGGFLLTAATIAELNATKVGADAAGGLRRALVIGRQGVDSRNALATRLEGAGVDVEVASERGWGTMVNHPDRSRLPAALNDLVETWLAKGAAAGDRAVGDGAAGSARGPVAEASRLELCTGEGEIVEEPRSVTLPFGPAFGILTRPAEPADVDFCAVFLNAGRVRHIGPNRMWVERARDWAAQGVPCLRLDLEGIGEGGGDPEGLPPGDEYFSSKFTPQLQGVLDALQQEGLGPNFLLVGLCSGGYLAFRTAVEDARVHTAISVNPAALVFRPGMFSEREVRDASSRLLSRRAVGRLLRNEISWLRVKALLRELRRATGHSLRRLMRRSERQDHWTVELAESMDRLKTSNTRLVLVFSEGEAMADELDEAGFPARLGEWPNVELVRFSAGDHTLRPIASQAALRDLLVAELSRQSASGRASTAKS
jgi:pimeloyl-ACP methyl ester carboxylesterase